MMNITKKHGNENGNILLPILLVLVLVLILVGWRIQTANSKNKNTLNSTEISSSDNSVLKTQDTPSTTKSTAVTPAKKSSQVTSPPASSGLTMTGKVFPSMCGSHAECGGLSFEDSSGNHWNVKMPNSKLQAYSNSSKTITITYVITDESSSTKTIDVLTVKE